MELSEIDWNRQSEVTPAVIGKVGCHIQRRYRGGGDTRVSENLPDDGALMGLEVRSDKKAPLLQPADDPGDICPNLVEVNGELRSLQARLFGDGDDSFWLWLFHVFFCSCITFLAGEAAGCWRLREERLNWLFRDLNEP